VQGTFRPSLATLASLSIVAAVGAVAGAVYHVDSIGREQVKTARALDQAGDALGSLTDDVVQRMVKRGQALDDDDLAFLRKVRGYYERWPLEPDPKAALIFRASGLKQIATVLDSVDRYQESRACWQSAFEAYDEIVRRGSDGQKWSVERIFAMSRVGLLSLRMNRPIEAEAMFRRVIAEGDRLTTTDPSLLSELTIEGDYLATALWDQGRHEEAFREFLETLDRFEKLRLENPESDVVPEAELVALGNLSLLYSKANRPIEAEKQSRKKLALAEDALKRFPGREYFLRAQTLALDAIVTIIMNDRPEEALTLNRRFVNLTRELADRFPKDTKHRDALVQAAQQTYSIDKLLGRPLEAEADLIEAIEEGHRNVRAEPAVYDRVRVLISAKSAQAELLEHSARPEQAIEQLDQIVELLRPWAGLKDRSTEVANGLFNAAHDSARLRCSRGEHAGAARRLESTLDLVDPKGRPSSSWISPESDSPRETSTPLARPPSRPPPTRAPPPRPPRSSSQSRPDPSPGPPIADRASEGQRG